jgi:hypothetical protein
MRVNAVERMAGGEVPVLILLRNAANRLRLLDQQEAVFERVLSRIERGAGEVPPLRDPTAGSPVFTLRLCRQLQPEHPIAMVWRLRCGASGQILAARRGSASSCLN